MSGKLYNCVIIGGGPSGARAAYELSKTTKNIALIDYRESLGDKLCTGIIGIECVEKYGIDKNLAIKPYVEASRKAKDLGLGVNAGHDLNLDNIEFFSKEITNLLEVSIGHALICESLYLGLENVIPMYIGKIK